MNTRKLGPDFTVIVANDEAWCDWFPTREQAVSYARLLLHMAMDRICVLDCHGAIVAEFNAPDARNPPDRSRVSSEDPIVAASSALATPFAGTPSVEL